MEFDPLLPPGLHDLNVNELENHFVDSFSSSNTRQFLIVGLRKYLDALKKVGVPIEVWIDGSFSTLKIDPNDVDLVIFAHSNHVNSLDEQKRQLLAWLCDRVSIKTQFGCDVLFSLAEDINQRSYWRGWYGYDRLERPKGIGKLMVLP